MSDKLAYDITGIIADFAQLYRAYERGERDGIATNIEQIVIKLQALDFSK